MTQIVYLRDKNARDLVLNSDGSLNAVVTGTLLVEGSTSILASNAVTITDVSGGVELGSGVVFNVIVRSQSGNDIMFIGGTGSNAPNSGRGLELYGGESVTVHVDNINKVRLFARTSGQRVSFLGHA